MRRRSHVLRDRGSLRSDRKTAPLPGFLTLGEVARLRGSGGDSLTLPTVCAPPCRLAPFDSDFHQRNDGPDNAIRYVGQSVYSEVAGPGRAPHVRCPLPARTGDDASQAKKRNWRAATATWRSAPPEAPFVGRGVTGPNADIPAMPGNYRNGNTALTNPTETRVIVVMSPRAGCKAQ